MSVPDLDLARVRRFCETKIPEHARHQVRLETTVRGNSVTVVERQARWRADFGPEWSTHPVAQLRWSPQWMTWRLYWRDRNTRWHVYPECEPTPSIERLLDEIDTDPLRTFWG